MRTCPLPPLEGLAGKPSGSCSPPADPHSHPPPRRYAPHPLHFHESSQTLVCMACLVMYGQVHICACTHMVFAHPFTTLYPTFFKCFSLTFPPSPCSQAHMPTHPCACTICTNITQPSYLSPCTDIDASRSPKCSISGAPRSCAHVPSYLHMCKCIQTRVHTCALVPFIQTLSWWAGPHR